VEKKYQEMRLKRGLEMLLSFLFSSTKMELESKSKRWLLEKKSLELMMYKLEINYYVAILKFE
jgi:hypothetical protein